MNFRDGSFDLEFKFLVHFSRVKIGPRASSPSPLRFFFSNASYKNFEIDILLKMVLMSNKKNTNVVKAPQDLKAGDVNYTLGV